MTKEDKKIFVSVVTFSKNKKLVKELKKYFPNSQINELGRRYSPNELINSLKDANGAIIGLDKINEDVLTHCPELEVISKHGIGIDKIDLDACKDYGVEFIHKGGGLNNRSVSELTLFMMLGLIRGGYSASLQLKEGSWNKYENNGRELTGKTVGIIGVGNIGKDLVTLLNPFNCYISVNDIRNDKEQLNFYKEKGLTNTTKEEIYKWCDIITIHTPLTKLTHNMITKKEFSQMKQKPFIMNIARGGIVNEEDLLWSLKEELISGAGLDVYSKEPPGESFEELLSLDNVICTPHIGGTSIESSLRLGYAAIQGLKEYYSIK